MKSSEIRTKGSFDVETLSDHWFVIAHILREGVAQLADAVEMLGRINGSIERFSDPTGFKVRERSLGGPTPPLTPNTEKENFMDKATKLKAGVDLQIVDNGKGVLYTLVPQKAGQPISLPTGTAPASISVSDPAALNVVPDPGDPNATPPRPADTTNLVFLGTLPTPPKDEDDVVATFNYTFPDGATLSAVAKGVDIVPAENDPDSFVIQESGL